MTWLALKTLLSPILAAAWRVLSFVIPIPVIVIMAAVAWLWFDRTSAVRQAVDKAVTELVAGAKLDALQDQAEAQRKLRQFALDNARAARQRAEALEAANADLFAKLVKAERDREDFERELDQQKDQPAPDGCVVDDALYDRLRNR